MPRLLYVPMYSSPDRLATDSTYSWSKIFLRSVVEEDPDAFVYCPVPENAANKYEEIDHPRIFKFPVPMYGGESQYLESGRLQEVYIQKFSDLYGPHFADIVVCDKASVIPTLKMGLEMFFTKARSPKVYLTKTHFIMDYEEMGSIGPELEMAQSLGYAMADVVLWMSEHEFQRGTHVAGKYISSALIDRLRETKMIGGWMPNFGLLSQIAGKLEDKRRSPVTLSWGYGGNSSYHVKEVLEIYDRVFKSRSDTHLLVTAPGGAGTTMGNILRPMSYAESYYGLPQAEFFRKLRDAHVFIYFPQRPYTTSASVIEKQQMGLVGVFCADDRRAANLYEGYPYLAKNKMEMFHMTKWLCDHYFDDEVQAVIKKQMAHNLTLFDPKDDSIKAYKLLLKKLEEKADDSKGKQSLVDLLHDATVGLPEVTLEQLILLVKKNSRIGLDLKDVGGLTHMGTCLGQVRHLMTRAGWKDACTSPDVVFQRSSEYKKEEE